MILSRIGLHAAPTNKSIADAFRLGTDIDTISRATITSRALTRVRNAARRVAEAYLINSEFSQTARNEISALETFAQLDWSGLIDAGLVRSSVPNWMNAPSLPLPWPTWGMDDWETC